MILISQFPNHFLCTSYKYVRVKTEFNTFYNLVPHYVHGIPTTCINQEILPQQQEIQLNTGHPTSSESGNKNRRGFFFGNLKYPNFRILYLFCLSQFSQVCMCVCVYIYLSLLLFRFYSYYLVKCKLQGKSLSVLVIALCLLPLYYVLCSVPVT